MSDATDTPIPGHRWPQIVGGVGVGLALVVVGELLAIGTGVATIHDGFVAGVVSVLPFLAGLVYGGYWLGRSDLSVDRYERIGGWFVASLAGFTLVVTGVVVTMRSMDALFVVSTVRWAASIGGCVGLVVGIFDARGIERELAAERLRVREEATARERDRLEEFASIVSHDLRNQLNVAAARLELAREDCDSPHLDDVYGALLRMDAIIDETMTLAQQGHAVGETEPVDLATVVDQSWKAVETADADLRTDGSAPVETDSDRLRHVFENLFRNAVDHGGEDVTVRVGLLPDGRGFYVEDDGPGIPEDRLPDVFEPGYTTARDGTGFGLAIVKRIVEAHGWEVTVTEGRDGGARFEITGVTTG